VVRIQRIHEQTRVSDLPAATAAHEPPQLLVPLPPLPRRLLLEGAEGSEVTLRGNDLFHRGGTESADQLVLQVRDAHVETEPFHLDAGEAGAEAGALEAAPEIAFLCSVTETRESDVEPLRAEQIQEASYRLRTADRHNGYPLSVEIPTAALGERLERYLVADSFNEDDRTRVGAWDSLPLLHAPYVPSSSVITAMSFGFARSLICRDCDIGPGYGGYRIFNRAETGVAGPMILPADSMQPLWQPYVAVADPTRAR
jgi:hypothetical protein